MFVKKVVLMMIILIGITVYAGTTNVGSLVCDVSNSEVAQVFTSDILAKLPVPKLHFDCLNTNPTGQGTAKVTTNLPMANQPTDPPLLTEGATVYQGQVSGNLTTFSNIPILQGTSSFDITNIQLNGTSGTPFTPIWATGVVYTKNTTSTCPAVTVGTSGRAAMAVRLSSGQISTSTSPM